jgi:hypothetical protein
MYKVDNNAESLLNGRTNSVVGHFIHNAQAYLMVELTALLSTLYIIHKPT